MRKKLLIELIADNIVIIISSITIIIIILFFNYTFGNVHYITRVFYGKLYTPLPWQEYIVSNTLEDPKILRLIQENHNQQCKNDFQDDLLTIECIAIDLRMNQLHNQLFWGYFNITPDSLVIYYQDQKIVKEKEQQQQKIKIQAESLLNNI